MWPTAIGLLVASVGPIVVLGAILIRAQARALTEQAMVQLDTLADARLGHVDQFNESVKDKLALIVSRTQMREDIATILAGEAAPSVELRLRRILDDATNATDGLHAVVITDLDGELVATTTARSMRMRPSIETMLGDLDDEAATSRIVVDPDFGAHWWVAALLEHEGAPIAVALIDMAPPNLVRADDPTGGDIGRLGAVTCVFHRDEGAEPVTLVATPGHVDQCAGYTLPVAGDRVKALAAVALRGEDTSFVDAVDGRGVEVMAATRHHDGFDLGLLVAVERDELLAPVEAGSRVMMVTTAGVAAIAVVVALLAARALTRPIRSLRDTAREVQQGGEAYADTAAPGELGELAAAFNAMTATIQRDKAELEHRYADLEVLTHAMAHDLRSPLATARGLLETLEQGRVTDEAQRRELLQRGLAATDRVQRLLDGLIALLRTTGQPLEMRRVELDEVVADAVLQLGLADVASWDELGAAEGDGVLLTQVLFNLLENAAKYHAADVLVRIHVSAEDVGDGLVAVHVDDAGSGIPVADRERVLGSFERGGASGEGHGSGLGLSIVSRVVERHGGDVHISDSPLGGARVTFTLHRISADTLPGDAVTARRGRER